MSLPSWTTRPLLVLGTLLLAVVPPSAAATELDDAPGAAQTWAVVPADADGPDGRARFEYVVEPGDRHEDAVAVRNIGTEPLTVEVAAHDAVTGPSGFEVLGPDDEARGIAAWLELETQRVTVAPRSSTVVPFHIDVPADAEPGDYAAAVMAVSLLDEQGEAGQTLVQYRVGSRMHVRVAGPVRPELRIESLTAQWDGPWTPWLAGEVAVAAELGNVGNVRLAPEASVEVSGPFGLWRESHRLADLEEVLPQCRLPVEELLAGPPRIGPLTVTVAVDGGRSGEQDLSGTLAPLSQSVTVWAVPWAAIVGLVLLLLAAVVAVRGRRARARRPTPPAAVPTAPAPTT